MHEGNRTEISTLGEFGLIKHLTQDITLQNNESKYGVGDDALPYWNSQRNSTGNHRPADGRGSFRLGIHSAETSGL